MTTEQEAANAREHFRRGFEAGWIECVGTSDHDKVKVAEIAQAAAGNYLKDPK